MSSYPILSCCVRILPVIGSGKLLKTLNIKVICIMISENVVTCFMFMAPRCQRCLSLKECEGCEFVAPNNWWYVRHIATCDQYKALQPRVCGIITNESMMKVAHQHNISEATSTSCGMMKSLGKENPTLLFVKNLRKRLRESRDSLLGYDANQLNATR